MKMEDMASLAFLSAWALVANWAAARMGYYRPDFAGHKGRPTVYFRDIFGVFALFLLIQLLVVPLGVVAYHFVMTGVWDFELDYDHGWLNLVAIAATALGLVFFCRILEPRTWGIIRFGPLNKLKKDLLWGASTWLICFPVVSLFSQFFTVLLQFYGIMPEFDQVAVRYLRQTFPDRWLFWSSFWMIIFVVPFIEETLFRGFLQTWISQRVSHVKAIVITSAIFALFHFSMSQGWHNIDLLAALFLLSCYLGFLYEKRGSIWASGALHMTFNAISEIVIVTQEAGWAG